LQSLFPEPIRSVTTLDPGYDSHASDVWRVETATGRWVVRASRLHGRPDNRYWGALRHLFGIDPRRLEALARVRQLLAPVSPVAIPQVYRIALVDGRPHAVVDWCEGGALETFSGAPPALLAAVGDYLGRVHSHSFPCLGAPDGGLQVAPGDWGEHLAQGMARIVAEFFPGDAELSAFLPEMQALARSLPAPSGGALVMPDLDASQFLGGPDGLTALVDLESYVLGPVELDLCGLELILRRQDVAPVVAAYTRHRPLPDLSASRPLYRFLHRLWEAQGNRPLATYLAYSHLF
jgi:hypothetical protein